MDEKEAKAIGEKYHADLEARLGASAKKRKQAREKANLKLEPK